MVRSLVARKLRTVSPSTNTRKKALEAHFSSIGVHFRSARRKRMATLTISTTEKVGNISSHLTGCHHQHNRSILSCATSEGTTTNNSSSAIFTPPASPPRLLLEGDELYVSRDGKSHTVYSLKKLSHTLNDSYSDLLLEESYDIERARKKMSLIGPSSLLNKDFDINKEYKTDQLTDIFSFDLQEINNGVERAGTGSMTWESSVVMGLYFALNPEELRGNVIELGSGLGLGGILSKLAKSMSYDPRSPSIADDVTVTLTDFNDEVLNMLEKNMNAAAKSSTRVFGDNIHIQKLDWFDFLGNGGESYAHQYDTVIASDCAYLHSHIDPLSETISKLLGYGNGQKLHMFAPYNRGVLCELIKELRDAKNMHVHIEDIEMSKFRVKQGEHCVSRLKSKYWLDKLKSSQDMTRVVSTFLHVTAWHKKRANEFDESPNVVESNKMTDID